MIEQPSPAPPSSAKDLLDSVLPVGNLTSDPLLASDCQAPSIELISPVAFAKACQLEGSVAYCLSIPSWGAKLCAAPAPEPVDLSAILQEYHEFVDVFSKSKANTLAPHHEYDLKIKLEEGTHPPLGTLYSLSPFELKALWTFLDKHLALGFIHPSSSSHTAPILFVRKKDGSLCLCVDFQGLNRIMKKDRYPLPHISDLLDAPSCAK